jgi:hypothetical protein
MAKHDFRFDLRIVVAIAALSLCELVAIVAAIFWLARP